jgi:hypothetical protein
MCVYYSSWTVWSCALLRKLVTSTQIFIRHFIVVVVVVVVVVIIIIIIIKSRDSSVGIALGYGLDDLGSRVRFPEKAGNFSLHHRV